MKVSELITKLNDVLEKEGDLEVITGSIGNLVQLDSETFTVDIFRKLRHKDCPDSTIHNFFELNSDYKRTDYDFIVSEPIKCIIIGD